MHDIYHQPTLADTDPARAKEAWRVTIIGAIANLLLAVVKLVAGIVGQSAAMVADAAHSISDLITDGVTLLSVKFASQGADEGHPYGHGRAETIGAVATGVALCFASLFMLWKIAENLIAQQFTIPTWPALAAAMLSIVIKEWLYLYTVRVGKRQNNQALVANAWHHRSDAFSSFAALIGIGVAMMGYPALDQLAALVVVFMIGKVGWDITAKSVQELMDRSLQPEQMKDIRRIIMETRDVLRFHELRTRRVGGDVFIDVHILTHPTISVSDAHNVAETVRANLKENGGVTDALVHIDAEDDIFYQAIHFDRQAIVETIDREATAMEGVVESNEVILHIMGGELCSEFVVRLDPAITFGEAQKTADRLRERILANTDLSAVVIRAALTDSIAETGFLKSPEERNNDH